MFPLAIGLTLGKRKNLSNQEAIKASVMTHLGAQMGGNVGTVLSTMSAVDAEANKNKLEQTSSQLNQVIHEKRQVEEDLKLLVNQMKNGRSNGRISFALTPEIEEILKRHQPVHTGNGSANGSASDALQLFFQSLKDFQENMNTMLKEHESRHKQQETGNRGAAGSSAEHSNPPKSTAPKG